MTTMAQGWVLLGILGVLAAGLLSVVSLALTSFRGELAGFRGEVGARFDAVATRFDGVDRRLDDLDRDVQALSDRVFRDRP
jgi:hypothetical protein